MGTAIVGVVVNVHVWVLVAVIVPVSVIVGLTVEVIVTEKVCDMVNVGVMLAVRVIVCVAVAVGEIVGVPATAAVSGAFGVLFFLHPKRSAKIKTITAAKIILKDFFIIFLRLLLFWSTGNNIQSGAGPFHYDVIINQIPVFVKKNTGFDFIKENRYY